MARKCSICSHPEQDAINERLVAGEANTKLSSEFVVSEAALRRHKEKHLPERLLRAREVEEISDADRLKTELQSVKADVRRLADRAEEEGDYRTALMGCDKALKALELQGKLLQLIETTRPQVNIHLSPEWLELRGLIVAAVEPHPEARESILRALEGASNGSA